MEEKIFVPKKERQRWTVDEIETLVELKTKRWKPKEIIRVIYQQFKITRTPLQVYQKLVALKKRGMDVFDAARKTTSAVTGYEEPENSSQAIKQLEVVIQILGNMKGYLEKSKEFELKNIKFHDKMRKMQEIFSTEGTNVQITQ